MIGKNWMITESCLFDSAGKPRKGAIRFLRAVCQQGDAFVVLTNHSTHLRSEMAAAYQDAGFDSIETANFYTSVMAGVDAILKSFPNRRTAGFLGGRGMEATLKEAGFAVNLEKADWVFVGTDRHASYEDYCYALRLLEGGAQIISTDPRRLEHIKSGVAVGSGSIVKMLEYAGTREALECGMPSPLIAQQALGYLDASAEDTVFIGCHLGSEIACGTDAGLKTVLVSSGLDENEDAVESDIRPDYVVEDLGGLLR
jgi:ribonucleotide monophosphatase NagD (HAD superfamily)